MKKVTEADFEKVRKYVSVMTSPYSGDRDPYMAKQQVYQEAKPAAIFLIEYYFTVVEPDNGYRTHQGENGRPYNSTVTERALNALNNGPYAGGNHGDVFFERHPNGLLEKAIVHYKASAKVRLSEALETPLSSMTGDQLLLILQENARRSAEGYPLVMPPKEGSDEAPSYKNPFQIMAHIDNLTKTDPNWKEATDGTPDADNGSSQTA